METSKPKITSRLFPKIGLVFSFVLLSLLSFGQEICDNAIDDDGDGLVDLNDTEDCFCTAGNAQLDIIPNPSFEEADCCPVIFNAEGEDFCLEDWAQGSFGTADYLNTCDFTTEGLPLPLPEGDGAIGLAAGLFEEDFGFGNEVLEYMSTCLLEPLETGETYTFNFSVAATLISQLGETLPIDFNDATITLYGIPNCFESAPTFSCPEPFGWVPLGTLEYTPVNEWQELSMDLEVNEDFPAIALGLGCGLDDSYLLDITDPDFPAPYFYFDDLSIFEGGVQPSNPIDLTYSNCNESATLIGAAGDFTYQWYFEGVAIIGETNQELFVEVDDQSAGTYSLVLTDFNGNCSTESVEVAGLDNDLIIGGEPLTGCPPLTVNFDSANTPGGLTLEWTIDGQVFQGEFLDYTFTNSGTYPISAQYVDGNGCVFDAEFEDPIVVSESPTLTPEFEVSGGCAPFTVELSVAEVTGSVCTWTLEDGTVIATDCNATYSYDGDSDFEVFVNDGDPDCEATGSILIPITVATEGDYTISGETEFCEGESSVITASPATNTYTWNGTVEGPSFEVTSAGNLILEILQPDGCAFEETISISTIGNPSLSLPPSITECLGTPLNLSSFAPGNEIQLDSTTAQAAIDFGGTLAFLVSNQCSTIRREVELIREDCECRVFIPNAFTPNGDGLNDLFVPQIDCELEEYELIIFNRWGQEVFRSDTPDISWNGNSGNSSFFAQAEVYSYILRYDGALDQLREPIQLTGAITVIR